jgi:putative transposase
MAASSEKKAKRNRGTGSRRSIRLPNYDYSQEGFYFVTICVQKAERLLGYISKGKMVVNPAGRMVQEVWDRLPSYCTGVEMDEFVVMPNHIHGIVRLGTSAVGATLCGCPDSGAPAQSGQPQRVAPTVSLPGVIHRFKSVTTANYAAEVGRSGWKPFRGRLWQRNYYEHVIRDERSLDRIREYVRNNPLRWHLDRENVNRTGEDGFDRWLSAEGNRPLLGKSVSE